MRTTSLHPHQADARPVLRSGEQRPASLISGGAGRLPPAYRDAMEPAGGSRVLTIRHEPRPAKKPSLGDMLMVLVSVLAIAVVTLGEGVVWLVREIAEALPHLPGLFVVLLFVGGAPLLAASIAQALH